MTDFGAVFFAGAALVTFLVTDALGAAFFTAVGFLTDFGAVFFAGAFLAAGFFATDFTVAFLALAGFLAAAFFGVLARFAVAIGSLLHAPENGPS